MRTIAPLLIEQQSVDAGRVRLALSGELDLATRHQLREHLRQLNARGQDVHLDLSNLEFIDAAGISVLIRALGQSRETHWQLEIGPELTPQVAKVFELTGVERPTV